MYTFNSYTTPHKEAEEVAKQYLEENKIPYNDLSDSCGPTFTILFKDDNEDEEFCDFVNYVNFWLKKEIEWYQVD